ncbi:hypothetical protein GLAREA_07126 [Glarea lozoyensis ATCC 20868]|uniref:Conserved oligomeric Golgi complex subunit 1 n=2 Tax=Glarea lozoyensis TaxID=101852 RepID=S3E6X5_GLAL2|nr:uncharacterized protein GLAREA_07126 [Glarea lozoyensis ATCC 20868]EHL01644.1 hypothetical protein M7I_2277 [Glarea lozoyensis 74030]EPE34113.1 hypothetical protein GLAREA_07126 [Glarea lozoyensis ATCC 20868]
MASSTLSPTTTTTASAAFLAPLPQVRQFHRQLTTSLDEKNARLRTLVGGSYRQLLGTAEMILEMRENIDVVEEKLGKVGKGCGRTVIGDMARGLATLEGERERAGLEWASRVKTLGATALVIGRLLKKGGGEDRVVRAKNLLTAAKVLVLSRLLLKSVGDLAATRSKGDREVVEEMRRKLAGSKRRLGRAINKTLEKTDGDQNREDLVLALSAYSLATSSGAKDVLQHFLRRIRGTALALAFDDEDEHVERHVPGVIKALELYTRTLLDVQALVPRRLSEALAGLKSKPLLKDPALRDVEGLRLDVCEKWFGEEILFFTPYIRHDDLEVSLAVETLHKWAKGASEVLLSGFTESLSKSNEFKHVVDLRTRILQIWIKDGGRARGFDPSILLDGLREAINDRLISLIETRLKKLHLVATEVSGTLSSWSTQRPETHTSLWDSSMLDFEITSGATLFKESIIARTHGRSDAVSRVFKGYQTWRHLTDEISTIMAQLKKQRWDDNLEDIEDDDVLESRNTLLSTEDPNMLQEHLNECLTKAYKDLDARLKELLELHGDDAEASIYILRIIRDLRSELPNHESLHSFGLALIPTLHERLATNVTLGPIESFSKTLRKKKVVGRALWEGKPELPVQPSPGTFKLLDQLMKAMVSVGGDLWSAVAVGVLKDKMSSDIAELWTEALQEVEAKEEQTNGEDEKITESPQLLSTSQPSSPTSSPTDNAPPPSIPVPQPSPAQRKDLFIQFLFDILLLQLSLASAQAKESSSDKFVKLGDKIKKEISLEPGEEKRLKASAEEYWKRSGLLFGLLL